MTTNENTERYVKGEVPPGEQEAPLTRETWTVMFEEAGGKIADTGWYSLSSL